MLVRTAALCQEKGLRVRPDLLLASAAALERHHHLYEAQVADEQKRTWGLPYRANVSALCVDAAEAYPDISTTSGDNWAEEVRRRPKARWCMSHLQATRA